jgi:uncharacterized membrane protein YkoI
MLTKSALALAAIVAALTCAAPAAAQDTGRHGRDGGRWAQEAQQRYGQGGYGKEDADRYGRPGGYRRDDRSNSRRYDRSDDEGRSPNSLGRGWGQQQGEARQGRMQGRFVPLAQVLSDLGRRYPGRSLDAGLEQRGAGQTVYRVRWFGQDGRRIDYIVDARTGAVLGQEGR